MISRRTTKAAMLLLPAAVTLALGLGVLELIFGSWLRSNPWDRALALNIVVDRKVTFDATGLYDNGGDVVYSRDRYGLRGNYRDPKDITVLTVGGSTTDQRYIGDGSTWQDELERGLRASGQQVTVANAGVDGHSTFAHLASYEYWFPLIPHLRPAYTVLYVGVNDFFLDDAPNTVFEGTADGAKTLKSRIKANSALFRLYSVMRGVLLARRAQLEHTPIDFHSLKYTDTPWLRNHAIIGRDRARAFKQRFDTLLQRVSGRGSIPVCVTQPTLYYRKGEGGKIFGVDLAIDAGIPEGTINGVDYFYLESANLAIIRSSCKAVGALTIDLAAEEWEIADFYDLEHMTPRGAKKVGERVAASMKNLPF